MQLREFISATLEEIASGIEDAQSNRSPGLATVNPRVKSGSGREIDGVPLIDVEIDVAVTATESGEASAGIRLSIFNLGAKVSDSSAAVHRVKVAIPVAFPVVNDLADP